MKESVIIFRNFSFTEAEILLHSWKIDSTSTVYVKWSNLSLSPEFTCIVVQERIVHVLSLVWL